MDRGLAATVAAAVLVVGALLLLGYRKALSVAGPVPPPTGGASPLPAASVVTPAAPTPPPVANGAPGVVTQREGLPAPTPDPDAVWLFDGAVLATRSLDDWAAFIQEESRPGVGTPAGVRRSRDDYTPMQRRLLLAGRIVVVPEAARVTVLQESGDQAQVRVETGEKAGSVGWISRRHLLYNRAGEFVPVYPVEMR